MGALGSPRRGCEWAVWSRSLAGLEGILALITHRARNCQRHCSPFQQVAGRTTGRQNHKTTLVSLEQGESPKASLILSLETEPAL